MPPFKNGVQDEHKPGGYPRMGCGPQRNKFVHTLIAEGMLGRSLKPDEHVHHIDGDTKNPHWSNLLVIGKAVHDAVSNRQYWYLKQKYSRERAAWWAYFDITGETPEEGKRRQQTKREKEISFEPETF